VKAPHKLSVRRKLSLKAVVLDSTIFAESKRRTQPTPIASGVASKAPSNHDYNVVEIDGVTDILTKYRSRLREKNIFQNTISRPSHNTGDAQLLQQAKKSIQGLHSSGDNGPIDAEMDTILSYIVQRGLKLYIGMFNSTTTPKNDVTSDDTRDLVTALKNKPLPLKIIENELDNVLDTVLEGHALDPTELIVFSNQSHILSLSKTRRVVTCQFGGSGEEHTAVTLSHRATHVAQDSDGVQSVIEENNGFSFL